MRIKSRLIILFTSVATVCIATLGGMLYADHRIDQVLLSSQKAYAIVNEVSELNRLATEISQGGIHRIQQQWDIKSTSLRQTINEYKEEKDTVISMNQELTQLGETFDKLMLIFYEELSLDFSGDFTQAKFYRLNHLTVLLHSLSTRADRLATTNFDRVRDVQRKRDIALTTLGVLWSIAIAIWTLTLWTGIMPPLRKLLQSIFIVGHGDLSHRIPVTGNGNGNEMNNLIRSFNSMLDRLQDLTVSRKRLLDATEQERSRIGRELHDGICQTMAGIRLKMESLQSDQWEEEKIHEIAGHLMQAQTDIKRIVKDLRPAMLDELGLVATLHWFSEQSRQTTLFVDVEEKDIPKDLRTPIFRIVQEATSNALQHGKAETIHIQLHRQDDTLNLFVEDNGHGFDTSKPPTGNGLINIRERVAAEQGDLTIDSSPDRGCCIIASFPIRGEE